MFLRGRWSGPFFSLAPAVWSQLGSNQRDHRVRSLTVKGINSAEPVAIEATSLDQTFSRGKALNSKMFCTGKLCQMFFFKMMGKWFSLFALRIFFISLYLWSQGQLFTNCCYVSAAWHADVTAEGGFVCRASWPSLRTNYTADHWLSHKYLHPLGTH